ncbi:MAG: type II secretion system F family protein [Chloroflexota bacterium]
MGILVGLTGAILGFVGVLLFFSGVRGLMAPGRAEGLRKYSTVPEGETTQASVFVRRILPIARRLTPKAGPLRKLVKLSDMERYLAAANYPNGVQPVDMIGLKMEGALGLSLLALLLLFAWAAQAPVFAVVIVLFMAIFGWFLPDVFLRGAAERRQKAITLGLPDFLDLMTVSVEAGMGFDLAIAHVTQRMKNPLSEELRRFLQELQMGVDRSTAYRHLRQRNFSPELQTFVGALEHAEDLGVPIAATLEMQSEDMRVSRMQRAEQKAAKASPNISLITIFITLPSAVCLMVALMVLNAIYNPTIFGLPTYMFGR